MLGLHPHIQDKVRVEVDRVMDDWDDMSVGDGVAGSLSPNCSDITTKHLREFKYLEQVIKEALRMWPSIPFVARQMTEDVTVGGECDNSKPYSSCLF